MQNDRMRILYSRHARKRMALYEISEKDIEKVIKNPAETLKTENGRTVAVRVLKPKFRGLPLKVIYIKEKDNIIVVSAYPLKKSYRR